MEAQKIILLLAEYVSQGLDPETASVLDQELNYHPKAVLFLLNYRYTLLFYKRHHHDENLGWMIEYLDKRIPGPLRELVEDLSYAGPLSLARKDGVTSQGGVFYK